MNRPRNRSSWARGLPLIGPVIEEFVDPGRSGAAGPQLWRFGRTAIAAAVIYTNLVGVAAVLVAAYLVVPLPAIGSVGHVKAVNALAASIYVALAVPVGSWLGTRHLRPVRDWLVTGGGAPVAVQKLILVAPLRLFVLQIGLWAGAGAVFGVINLVYSLRLAAAVVATTVIAGFMTAACAYLITERALRPGTVRALAGGLPPEVAGPGVATRSILAWALGSGLPVFAMMVIGALELIGIRTGAHQLALTMVMLGGIATAVGLLAVTLAARATAGPIEEVRRALEQVQEGQLGTRVAVYDGTQIGRLQQGFNQMAEGLAERERLREALGTYVDPDVAERILDDGISPEGEMVEVTVMFVDVRDFTPFAGSQPPAQVVAALNGLFAVLVPLIHAHGGRVDKFIGDGLMAVFGAPRRFPDHADRALAAAWQIARRASHRSPLAIGIGLNSGPVVAGNVGADGRLEFSVIGDAVNVAARVEAATRQTGDRLLVAERTVQLADGRWEWEERHGVVLKGTGDGVRVYSPRRPPPPWEIEAGAATDGSETEAVPPVTNG